MDEEVQVETPGVESASSEHIRPLRSPRQTSFVPFLDSSAGGIDAFGETLVPDDFSTLVGETNDRFDLTVWS